MDQATKDKIIRDNAYHQAALARRAEAFEQEIEHRRLMLGLERFHEFEMANIRRQAIALPEPERNRAVRPVPGSREARDGAGSPGRTLFKQVAEDGSGVAEPSYLRIVWVDSDRGGLFRWTNVVTEEAEEDDSNEEEAVRKTRESKDKD